MERGNAGKVTVKFRELVRANFVPVPGSNNAFMSVATVNVNPGLVTSFPWLSTIARNYDQWSMKRIRYQYVPGVSASTNGFFSMYPDFDVTDTRAQTMLQAMNQLNAVSTPVWCGIDMDLRPPAAMAIGPRRFIRQANTMNDNRLSDVAVIYCFTSGYDFETGVLPAQLWCEYEIELYAPQINPGRSAENLRSGTKTTRITGFTLGDEEELQSGQSVETSAPLRSDDTEFRNNGLGVEGPEEGVPLVGKIFASPSDVPTIMEVELEPRGVMEPFSVSNFTGVGTSTLQIAIEAVDYLGNLLPDQSFIQTLLAGGKTALALAGTNNVPFAGESYKFLINELDGRQKNQTHVGPIYYRALTSVVNGFGGWPPETYRLSHIGATGATIFGMLCDLVIKAT